MRPWAVIVADTSSALPTFPLLLPFSCNQALLPAPLALCLCLFLAMRPFSACMCARTEDQEINPRNGPQPMSDRSWWISTPEPLSLW